MPHLIGRRRPSLLSALCLVLGVLCWGCSFVPRPVLASLLTVEGGATARQAAELLPGLFRGVGTLLLATSAAAWLFRDALHRGLSRAAGILELRATGARNERRAFLGLILALALLQDAPSLPGGYFESDDFSLLNDNRRLSWSQLVTATHNDHVLALFRLELRLAHALFGVWAPAYNAAALLTFALLLWSGALLLMESGARRLSVLLFVLLCGLWTAWGAFTTGYYVLQVYMQIAICGALALCGWARWRRTKAAGGLWLAAGCTVVSAWLNVSGFYVACALAACAAIEAHVSGARWSVLQSVRRQRLPLLVLAVGLAVALVFTAYAYAAPENTGLLSGTSRGHTAGTFTVQLVSYLGTLLLSLYVPLPHHLARLGLLAPAIVAGLTLFAAAAWTAYRWLDPPRRSLLLGSSLAALGVGAMTCLGRPAFEFDMIWPAKYTGPGFFWACLALAMVADGLRERFAAVPSIRWLKAVLVAVAASGAAQLAADAACAQGLDFFRYDVTRHSALREHRRERAALQHLAADLQPLFAIDGALAIPNLEGPLLCGRYPALEFTWGQQPGLATFAEVLTDRPGRIDFLQRPGGPPPRERNVRIVPSLRGSTTPAFLQLLESDETLRGLWLGPASLDTTFSWQLPVGAAAELSGPDGRSVAGSAPQGGWDPERWHMARIAVERPLRETRPTIALEFHGERFGASPVHRVRWPEGDGAVLEIDLLRFNGYALESRIDSVRVELVDTAGNAVLVATW